jgi:hypothetical protein
MAFALPVHQVKSRKMPAAVKTALQGGIPHLIRRVVDRAKLEKLLFRANYVKFVLEVNIKMKKVKENAKIVLQEQPQRDVKSVLLGNISPVNCVMLVRQDTGR